MSQTCVIDIDEDNCSLCSICSSVCPFDALEVDEEKGRLILDVEKCQVCGLCYSACPASAINLLYYEPDSLLAYLEKKMGETGLKTLALVCRGVSPPPSGKVRDFLAKQGFEDYILIRVPCVGRIPLEFYLRALRMGIERIIVVQCDEDYCRFKDGSDVSRKRLTLLSYVLRELGFGEDTILCYTNPMRAIYVTENCVGCGKCAFICPYDAITLQPGGTPTIDLDSCVGCGVCAVVCPHQAIQLEGYEYDVVSTLIHEYASMIKTRPSILVFICQWSEFTALDRVKNGLYNEKTAVIEIPCLKGLDPAWIVEALYSGFDGVLVIACPEEKCKLERGTEIAERNVEDAENILEKLGLMDRFQIYRSTPIYLNQFDFMLKEFSDKLSGIAGR